MMRAALIGAVFGVWGCVEAVSAERPGAVSAEPPPRKVSEARATFAATAATAAERSSTIEVTPAPAPAPAPAPPVEPVERPRSERLPSGFWNPMPGGVFAGYQGDTGLDIGGSPRPVYAIAPGTLDYSEPGHTLWTGPKDTPNCVRFELDTPINYKGRKITHVYYAHLSALEHRQREGESPRRHVEGGELLGVSGVANHSPHLHIGLLLDGEVEQYWGTFLRANEVLEVLGNYRNGTRLPAEKGSGARR